MNHRFIVTRMHLQISHDGGEAEMIGTNHEADDYDNEPLEGGGSGEASSKCRQDFIYIFQHGMVDRDEIG